jgi:ABC-type uncharacterized transport system permease subunit
VFFLSVAVRVHTVGVDDSVGTGVGVSVGVIVAVGVETSPIDRVVAGVGVAVWVGVGVTVRVADAAGGKAGDPGVAARKMSVRPRKISPNNHPPSWRTVLELPPLSGREPN